MNSTHLLIFKIKNLRVALLRPCEYVKLSYLQGLISACLLALSFYTPVYAQDSHIITLNETVIIDADIVTLGDVFTGLDQKLAQTSISRAPSFGKVITWNYRVLARLAKRYRLNWQPQSRLDQIKISRRSIIVSRQDVEIALKQSLKEFYSPDSDLDIQMDSAAISIPVSPLINPTPLIEDLKIDQQNNRFVSIIVLDAESQKPIRRKFSGRVYEMRSIPVLDTVVPAQTAITEQDLKWIRVKAQQLRQNILTDSSQIVGKTPKRNLQVGQLIKTNDIEDVRYVTRGDQVTLSLQASSLRLTVQGKAMDSGTLGDVIRIKNLQSNKIVNGKIIAYGQVIVTSPLARPLK